MFDFVGELIDEYNKILQQEGIFWLQKSQAKSLVKRERNTRFCHTSAIIKQNKKSIRMLKDGASIWQYDMFVLQTLIRDF